MSPHCDPCGSMEYSLTRRVFRLFLIRRMDCNVICAANMADQRRNRFTPHTTDSNKSRSESFDVHSFLLRVLDRFTRRFDRISRFVSINPIIFEKRVVRSPPASKCAFSSILEILGNSRKFWNIYQCLCNLLLFDIELILRGSVQFLTENFCHQTNQFQVYYV